MKSTLTHPIAGFIYLLLFWYIAIWLLSPFIPFIHAFSPDIAIRTVFSLIADKGIWLHLFSSIKRIAAGLMIALLIGIPIGLIVGVSPAFERLTGGVFQYLRMISPLSLMPIAVMIFGIGDLPIIALIAFACVWSLIINTATGVKKIDPNYLALGKSLNATKSETLRHIILPATIGDMLTGLRISLGVAWVVLVPCEMLGVSSGLGYFILDTRDRLSYNELAAAIVIIGIIGWTLDSMARYICRKQ